MARQRHITLRFLLLGLLLLGACRSGSDDAGGREPATHAAITVGSFDFAENELLAELYSQALEGAGYDVRRVFNIGPREFVGPALARGLLDLVPEYAGTALRFLSLGSVQPAPDVAATHAELARTLAPAGLTALSPAPAQNANTFVVTRRTSERLRVGSLSDMGPVAPRLTFGGPPECSTRPYCLVGLERVYGLRFKEVVPLDAGGPLTHQALREGAVDVALLFTTDPALGNDGLVALADDRHLQPADNLTPLVRTEVLARAGPRLSQVVDAVSERLTTDELRALNARVAGGAALPTVAATWLRSEGLR